MNAHATPKPAALSARALAFHDVLQAVADGAATSADVCKTTGRVPNNMACDLANLEADGVLVRAPALALTDDGRRVLRILAAADGEPGSPAGPAAEGYVQLMAVQILPDPANPRRDFDSADAREAIDELGSSIFQLGRVLQNLVVRRVTSNDYVKIRNEAGEILPFYQLVSGERRWRAVMNLIERGAVPPEFPVPALVVDIDDAEARRMALIENLKRVDLKPLEEARAYKGLVDADMTTMEVAVEVLGSHTKLRYVQQRIQLLELTAKQQAHLENGTLTIKQALEILRSRPAPIEVSDDQLLTLAEIREKIRRDADPSHTSRTEIAPDADVTALAALVGYPVYIVDFTRDDYHTGRDYASLASKGADFLEEKGLPAKGWDDAYAALRLRVLGAERVEALGDTFATPWLNGPWTLNNERAVKIAERDAEFERGRRAEAQREAERRARAALIADLVETVRAESPTETGTANAGFVEVLDQAASPLPWFFNQEEYQPCEILDANGKTVVQGRLWKQYTGSTEEHARFRMIVFAANTAAGLATPTEKPVPLDDRPLDEAGFLAALGAELLRRRETVDLPESAAKAQEILAAGLARLDMDFGDEAYVWCVAFAKDMVTDALNGFGRPSADEDEDDDADDGEDGEDA